MKFKNKNKNRAFGDVFYLVIAAGVAVVAGVILMIVYIVHPKHGAPPTQIKTEAGAWLNPIDVP